MQALVIDDSKTMRRLLRGILHAAGFAVEEAENGRDGLERLRRLGGAAVVLVDWNMPVMDGVAFLRAARADPACGSFRAVLVTTETDPSRVAEALAAGADAYVAKPFTPATIRQQLVPLTLPSPSSDGGEGRVRGAPAKDERLRALVIDDARTMRLILKQVLSEIGFAVSEAGDGRAGLEQLARLGRPDVVFVDGFMPGMDGFAFLRAVRADARYAGVRVLMVSAGEPEEEARAREAGADDFLPKPFTQETVLATLGRVGVAAGTAR